MNQTDRLKLSLSALGNVRVMVAASFLVAMSIVLGKYLPLFNIDVLRFSLENLPILLAGIAFGPAVGAVVGLLADLIGCLLVGYAINPFVMLGAVLIGFLSGLLPILLSKNPLWLQIGAAVLSAHLVGSVLVKSFGLAVFYDWPLWQLMLIRLLNYILLGVAEFTLLFLLLRHKMVQKQLRKMKDGRYL